MIIKDELLYAVDGLNNPIKPEPRKRAHTNGTWHRTSQIWIVNDKQQILCQRRSLLKDTNPGKWEAIFGGHLTPKQEYIDCAIIELREELGIEATREDLHFLFINKSEKDKEFQGIFSISWNGNSSHLQLEKEEVEEVKWISIENLLKLFKEKDDNWSSFSYETKLLKKWKNQ